MRRLELFFALSFSFPLLVRSCLILLSIFCCCAPYLLLLLHFMRFLPAAFATFHLRSLALAGKGDSERPKVWSTTRPLNIQYMLTFIWRYIYIFTYLFANVCARLSTSSPPRRNYDFLLPKGIKLALTGAVSCVVYGSVCVCVCMCALHVPDDSPSAQPLP